MSLAACRSTHQDSKQEAVQRWNHIRAQVKARLASDQLAAGNVADASAQLAEAYGLAPTIPELTPLLARVRLANGELAEAQRLLASMAGTGPVRAEADYLLGVTYQQQAQWERALDHFARAAENDPDEVAYLVAVSQTFLQLGMADEALVRLQAGEPAFGWTPAYRATLAECYEQLGRWAEAASAWRKVVDGTTAALDIRERYAIALYRAGRLPEAGAVLTQLVEEAEFEPSDALRLTLADCLAADGRLAASRQHVAQVLARDERNVAALHLLARLLSAEGAMSRALRTARHALEIDPSNLRSRELAAALAWRVGDQALARTLAVRLLELQADNLVARRILALTDAARRSPDAE